MPEGPRTIHIFMNFLQCYSLWRTVFEPNHCEYRVDLLNWHEHSCPTFKMPAPKIVLHPFWTQWSSTNVSGETDNLSVIQDDLSIVQDIRDCCSRNLPTVGIFSACWLPPGLWPSGTERVWHPYSGNGQANMADQTSATIVRLVQTGEMHQLSIFDHFVGEIDAPYYS